MKRENGEQRDSPEVCGMSKGNGGPCRTSCSIDDLEIGRGPGTTDVQSIRMIALGNSELHPVRAAGQDVNMTKSGFQ